MKLTESKIKFVIENVVRHYLSEGDEEQVDKNTNKQFSANELRKNLRNDLINISDVAESYPPWKDWAEGTARSLLSRFSLGHVDLSDKDVQGIGRHLKKYMTNNTRKLSI